MANKLTPKQELFAQAVASGDYKTVAYKKAYPRSVNWSDHAVETEASRAAMKPIIAERIAELQARIMKKNELEIEDILREMANWVMFNPKNILTEHGAVKQFEDMSDDEAKCITEFTVEEIWHGRGEDRVLAGYLKKIKLVDKRATADMFMKKFGAYIDKKEHSIKDLSHLKELLNEIKE